MLGRGATSINRSCPWSMKSVLLIGYQLTNRITEEYFVRCLYCTVCVHWSGSWHSTCVQCTYISNIGMSVNVAVGCMQGSVVLHHNLLHGLCFIVTYGLIAHLHWFPRFANPFPPFFHISVRIWNVSLAFDDFILWGIICQIITVYN